MTRGRWFFVPAALAAVLAGAGIAHYDTGGEKRAHAAPLLQLGDTTIADIAEKAAPSVVNISSTQMVSTTQGTPHGADPFFFSPFSPGHGTPGEREQRGLGSGVIVSDDGVILTNNHVIEKASQIEVVLADGREFDAKVVGVDPKSDLAVIKLEGPVDNLTPITFGQSADLRLGDVVLAIGNPFGVGQTVTMGIVSAKGRANVGIVDYEDFIQTDAAINPGNSGGALVNMKGELVGINTAILSRTGGYQGVGFAIPSSMVRPIADALISDGKVSRGWLGVGIQDLKRDLAEGLGLSIRDGVLVSNVMAGTPAAQAGLVRGDVIVEVDGASTRNAGQLRNRIAMAGANQTVTLGLWRDGAKKSLQVTLGEMPQEGQVATRKPGASKDAPAGLQVRPLDDSMRQRLDIPATIDGVVITNLDRASPAARAGLRPGDVVLEVNRKAVTSAQTFQSAYDGAKGKVVLLVFRGGNTVYLVIEK
jgi:serine protease Do